MEIQDFSTKLLSVKSFVYIQMKIHMFIGGFSSQNYPLRTHFVLYQHSTEQFDLFPIPLNLLSEGHMH